MHTASQQFRIPVTIKIMKSGNRLHFGKIAIMTTHKSMMVESTELFQESLNDMRGQS